MINKVTITGADTNTNQNVLIELSKEYPFVEWGILVSRSRVGTNRYPTMEWIKRLCFDKYQKNEKMNLSLHICGKMCQEVLSGVLPEELTDSKFPLTSHFDRMQLNFNFFKSKINFIEFVSLMGKLDNKIILQYNKSNKMLLDIFLQYTDSKFNYLYDASGGRGITGEWTSPLSSYTGYAGGLNPDNLEEELSKIKSVVSDQKIWIDAETGVRTNDEFDIDKVIQFLDISKKYVV